MFVFAQSGLQNQPANAVAQSAPVAADLAVLVVFSLQQTHSSRFIFMLRTLILTLNNNVCWQMRQTNSRVRCIDVLATSTT